ncbi:sulfotransferase [Proteobacteria bacterium 005FR1]|nr:sulfotransferase [Proteobacteria bacterium 005FR1]
MSVLSKARKLSLIASNPHILTCNTGYLFLLSHMRSRSSVLSHVLGSNAEICGYSELHRAYRNRMDLLKMRAELFDEIRCPLDNKYLLDKLLHNSCSISDEIFERVQPKVIFLLREPQATLRSIINMGHRTGVAWYKDPDQAGNYYCARLAAIEDYASRIRGQYYFVDADDLVSDTDGVLKGLSGWLGLEEPLARHYSQFANTGRRNYGDSSEHIKSGVIKKTEGHPEVALPTEVLDRARRSYADCKQYLLANDAVVRLVKKSA